MKTFFIFAHLMLSLGLAAASPTLPSLPDLTQLIKNSKELHEQWNKQCSYKKSFNELEIVTQFVHEQLHVIGFPNPETVPVQFGQGYNSHITVPRELAIIIIEYNNTEKFITDEHFKQWYYTLCTKNPEYQKLYEHVIELIQQKAWEDELTSIKDLIRQQEIENYQAAQGIIDHEATHILKSPPGGYTTSIFCATILSGLLDIDQKTFRANTYFRKILYTLQGAALAALLATRYLDRQHEWEADEGTRNDIAILRATANWHESLQRSWLSKKLNPSANYFFNCLLLPFLTHPTSAARAKRLRQRADILAAAHKTASSMS